MPEITYRDFVALLALSQHVKAARERAPKASISSWKANRERRDWLEDHPMPTVLADIGGTEREAYLDPDAGPDGMVFVALAESCRYPLSDVRGFRPTEASAKSLRIQAEAHDGSAAAVGKPDHRGATG